MTKTELIKNVAKTTGKTQNDVKEIVDATIAAITVSLACGNKVSIADFGSFSTVQRAERNYHNPATHETSTAPAHVAVKFQPATFLKNAVQ